MITTSGGSRQHATLIALIRSAEWAVEEARRLHQVTMATLTKTALEHQESMARLLDSEHLRSDWLARGGIQAELLNMANLNHLLLLQSEKQIREQLEVDQVRADESNIQLLNARTLLQVYQRLNERKLATAALDLQRRQQVELDGSGTVLKLHSNFDHNAFEQAG